MPNGQAAVGCPTSQQPWPPLPPAPVKQRRKWPWIVSALVVLLLIMIIGAAGSKGTGASTSSTSAPSANAGPHTSAQLAAAPAAAPAKPPRAISARDWAKIAKDPGAHVGEAIILYGAVTQFDTATGTNTFRANVDGVKHPVSYGFANYPTNTVLTGDSANLGDLVEGDIFQAEVVVAGAISYETAMGGNLSAPRLSVLKITVIGSTK
jgi:hypothetical protein